LGLIIWVYIRGDFAPGGRSWGLYFGLMSGGILPYIGGFGPGTCVKGRRGTYVRGAYVQGFMRGAGLMCGVFVLGASVMGRLCQGLMIGWLDSFQL